MGDHLPEDLVRAEEIDVLLAALCDDPCKAPSVEGGCMCAMIRQIVTNLRAAADGARREAVVACIDAIPETIGDDNNDAWDSGWDAAIRESAERIAKLASHTPPQPDPVSAAREAVMRAESTEGALQPNHGDDPEEGRSTGEPVGPGIGNDPAAPSVDARRSAIVAAAMRQWHWLTTTGEADGEELSEACAALAALEKGEG